MNISFTCLGFAIDSRSHRLFNVCRHFESFITHFCAPLRSQGMSSKNEINSISKNKEQFRIPNRSFSISSSTGVDTLFEVLNRL